MIRDEASESHFMHRTALLSLSVSPFLTSDMYIISIE